MNRSIIALGVAAALMSVGCARVGTGEVGVRVGFDKQIHPNELMPGSFNQTLVGDVLHFPTRDIRLDVDDMKPQTSDNSTLSDFDITLVYNIEPSAVAEIYMTKSHGFHYYDSKSGEIFLMYQYLHTIARNAAYKSARKYEALKIADNRGLIEADIHASMLESLKEEKLDSAIRVTQVQARNIQPAVEIITSANQVIQQQNALKAKTVEVEVTRKEAERLTMLSNNVEIMRLQIQKDFVAALKENKGTVYVIPTNMTSFMVNK